MTKKTVLVKLFFFLAVSILLTTIASASPRNLLPRLPELIIEDGLSSDFLVTNCSAEVHISGNEAQSRINVQIVSRSTEELTGSIKYRILYPISSSDIRIRANEQRIDFNPSNPRLGFILEPGEEINIDIRVRTSTNYSVDAVRRALRQEEEDRQGKRSRRGFALSDLARFFSRERFGNRFMVGPIISKWGIFPLEIQQASITLRIPSSYTLVTESPEIWEKTTSSNELVFKTTNPDYFSGAVFLPEDDKDDFIKTQEILTSERFMH